MSYLYFTYLLQMDDDSRCALCGQLMGMVRFYIHTFGSTPTVFTLTTNKFAVKHVQKYLLVSIQCNYPHHLLSQKIDLYYDYV